MTHRKKDKKLLIPLSLTTLVAVFPSEVFAQSINCVNRLIFGSIITCGAAGTVTVRPDGTSTSSCVTVGGPISRARCFVTQSFPFRPIQFSVNAATATMTNGTTNMNITSFNIITNAGGMTTTQTVPALDVPIGGTLNVGGTQAAGTYLGSFGVTAILQ